MSQRNVVITGVTRGIGHALLQPLTDRGCVVFGCGRNRDSIDTLKATYLSPHHFESVDVSDWNQVKSWSDAIVSDGGIPDLIINNAGIINKNASLWNVPPEEFDAVMKVNVCGTVNVIRAFTPAMIQNGGGIIVNISSGWGRSTSPEVAPYCASKWAIEGLTQALAQELPSEMAAIAMNPGIIDTDMLRSCWGDAAGSFPQPDQWALRAVEILLSLRETDNGRSMSID